MTMGLIAVVDVLFFVLVTMFFNAALKSVGATFSGKLLSVTNVVENRYAVAMIPLGVAAIVCHIAVLIWMTHFLVTRVQPVLEAARQQKNRNMSYETQMLDVTGKVTHAAGLMKKSVRCLHRVLGLHGPSNESTNKEKQDTFKHS